MKKNGIAYTAATIVAVIGINLLSFSNQAQSQQVQVLESGQTVSARISEGESRIFKVKGRSKLGNEYSFEAKPGYTIKATAVPETKANISLALVGPDGNQVAFADNRLLGSISIGGTWRLRVLGPDDDTTVRYSLGITIKNADGVEQKPTEPIKRLPFADQVMKDHGLNSVPCGSPELAVIKFDNVTRCTANYPKGQYVYDAASNTLVPLDPPEIALVKSWGLTTTFCNSKAVEISVNGKDVCVMPTLVIPAGKYTYDFATNELIPTEVELLQNTGQSIPEAMPGSTF